MAIEKHGRVVNFMTTAYHVLPNYDIHKLVSPLLSDKNINAVPLDTSNQRHGQWTGKRVGHTVYDTDGTDMVSTYMFPEEFDITGNNDKVKCGFTFKNSEAGHGAFSVSPFTLRNSCDNRMYHLAHESILGFGVRIEVEKTLTLQDKVKQIVDAKADYSKDIRGFKKRHSNSLRLEDITKALIQIRLGAENVINRYKEMYELKVLQVQAEQIARRFPKFVLETLDWIEYDAKKDVVDFVDPDVLQWDAMNDITKALTHEGKTFAPTLHQYKILDQILVQHGGKQVVA
jgi:hypothetical protein